MNTNKTQAEQLPQDAVMQSVLKQNDCRYGNYIIYGGSITQLNEKEMCHFFRFPETYKPIPLTEEWLLKFGFKKDIIVDLYRLHNQFGSIIYYPSTSAEKAKINFMLTGACFMNNTITNVHQLQNLYFALTGRELTVA